MQKSIFKRYLGVTMITILVSFALLGGMVMLFFSQYWRNEKKELLTKNALSVAGMAGRYLEQETSVPEKMMQGYLESFSSSMDADLFVTDLEGGVLMSSCTNSRIDAPQSVPSEAVAAAAAGQYESKGNFGGLYIGNFYIIGVPVRATSGSEVIGTVFAATSATTINAMAHELLKIFLVAAAGAFLIGFCIVGGFAYKMVRPLRQMSAAARSFGAGDFSVRVPVTSNDEIGQLAVSFNNMANSLSISEGTRRSFVANVSHELKTPMTTIAGFIDGILDGTIPESEQDKYLKVVSSEVKRLSRLVKSMLDLSRIDNGEMRISPQSFDITNTIVTTLLTFERSIEEKNIEVEGLEDAMPQTVWGDQDLLHQVVYNLIENAVKFTNPGGYIKFQIADGIDRTTIAVENSGHGIDSEELPRVFERFYKTDKSRSQDKNGMGLGLYIVHTILKLHGGDITVSSVPEQYTRFEFYIPKPSEQPKLKETSKQKQPKLKPAKAAQQEKDDPERSGKK